MTRRTREWIAWGAIVGFLPLYVAVALQLRPGMVGTFGAGQLRARAVAYVALAAVLCALALGLGRPLRRLERAASLMIRWHLAEGVAICGFLAWVEGGSPVQFAVHAAVATAALVALRPTDARDASSG